MSSCDVAIVGAGIVGAACAYFLSHAGLRVALIDGASPATGTTAAGMGHIVVMDDSAAQLALTAYSRRLWHELAPQLPPECEYQRCGTIWVASNESEMNEARKKHDLLTSHGIDAQLLDGSTLRKAEPQLRHGLIGGLLVEGDAVVYQLAATRVLVERSRRLGTKTHFGSPVVTISDRSVVTADGTLFSTGIVINAAGAAASRLSPQLKITAKKGHLVITDRYPGFISHQVLELGYSKSAHGAATDSVAFNVQPRPTGQILIGSSRQLGQDDDEIDRKILRRMTERACEYLPALRRMSAIRAWTGIRPATADNLPYIGAIAGMRGVFAAAGHEGLGITTSLGTAALLTDIILERPTAIPIEPYSPARIAL